MIATLTLFAAAALSPAFELELGGGVAHSLETLLGDEYPLAVPAVQGRAAIDYAPGLAFGGMFLAVVGGEAPNRVGCCSDPAQYGLSTSALLLLVSVGFTVGR